MRFPVSSTNLRFLAGGPAEPDEFDGERRRDADGRPMSKLPVIVAGASRVPEVIVVKVVGSPELEALREFQPLDVQGLAVRYWTMGDRSGLSFTADTIRPLAAKAAPQARGGES